MIHADDPTVKGGAWYPLTVKKIVRALDIAHRESAAARAPVRFRGRPAAAAVGRCFRTATWRGGYSATSRVLSKMGVKQLALVFGHCTAGGAYIPALSDYNVIVRGTGAVFLGGPPLVKAATGEVVERR